MRIPLATFQCSRVRFRLCCERVYRAQWVREQIYRANWQRVGPTDPWNMAYRWMELQMTRRGLPTYGHPPIWAWPMEPHYGGPPNIGTAYALLSRAALEAGVWVIELSVPEQYCLLSSYSIWNSVLDDFIDGKSVIGVPTGLFDIPGYRFPRTGQPDDLQFSLPHIDGRWIKDIRPLPHYTTETVDWSRPV